MGGERGRCAECHGGEQDHESGRGYQNSPQLHNVAPPREGVHPSWGSSRVSVDLCAAPGWKRPSEGSRLRRRHLGRARRPDDLQMRLPTPRALQLQEHLSRLDFVDDVTQPSVASKATELALCRWGHDQPSLERVLSGELRSAAKPDSTLMRLSIGRGPRVTTA